MLIATKNLYIGGILAARPGNTVDPDTAAKYGWADGVKEVRDPKAAKPAATPRPAPAKKAPAKARPAARGTRRR